MRCRLGVLILLCSVVALPVGAQETRGNISGTVSDATGVIPGATVKITHVDTGVSQTLVSNANGFFNAPLLNPGSYTVIVEMTGFKTLTRSGLNLGVGQQLELNLTIEIGSVTEQVNVIAEAPLLDTSAVSSGQNFDRKLLEGLPVFSNTPSLLLRYAPGVNATDAPQYIGQGYVAAGSTQVTPLGGVGATEWTIDGATNGGVDRRQAQIPTTDMVQEVRVESSNFDAATGHGTGLQLSLMTRAGTNAVRGSANYQHWTNKLNAMNVTQKQTFQGSPSTEDAWLDGRSHQFVGTIGGPLSIKNVIDGHNKLFYFVSFSTSNETIPGRNQPTVTIPTRNHLNGDFSDLLQLPSASQYQIYDPLTVRPDPARPGKFIRTPFPNNIIPKDRFMNADGSYKNPLFGLYQAMVPEPNRNFITPTTAPTSNYFEGAQPNLNTYTQTALRLDYNISANDRFYFRTAGSRYFESLFDWTYEAPDPKYHDLHSDDMRRYTWSFLGDWTHSAGSMVIDTQVAANRYGERNYYYKQHDYSPGLVGLPAYMDDYCAARGDCKLPLVGISGYQGMSNNAEGGLHTTNIQAQTNITNVVGSHTLRSGVDVRQARRYDGPDGNPSGNFSFDATYTRAADTTVDFAANNLGPSMAAFMLGYPTTVSASEDTDDFLTNAYVAGFFQDQWRMTRNLTLNVGLRYEWENGIKEKDGRYLVGYDPDAKLAITDLAQAAYARNPIVQVPVADFRVLGGALYADPDTRTWAGQSMWMPRIGLAYKWGPRTVVKGGYGIYYDTLNATAQGVTQTGYSVTTSNVSSTDHGQNWLLGNPKAGILPLTDPFPVRGDGTRFDVPIGDSLGVDTLSGSTYSVNNVSREHPRVQRWRVSVQRELTPSTAIELAYSGTYGDNLSMNVSQSYVPEQYWSDANVRDTTMQTLLQQNVTNPFNISNFQPLRTTNPTLYNRMAGNAFFTATTVQRQNLIRAFPQNVVGSGGNVNGVTYNALPLQQNKTNSFEVSIQRRYAHGVSGNFNYTYTKQLEFIRVNDYEREPTLWQEGNDARPHRITASGVWELPFGDGRKYLNEGGVLATIVGNWQFSSTFEWQPSGLLNWGNLFFYGDLESIPLENPTLDRWFNTDAGFEKDPNKTPANFQKRVFPFRVEQVRGFTLVMLNTSLGRTIDMGGGQRIDLRINAQNLLNRQHWQGPNLTPTSTDFGRITQPSGAAMRFITLVLKYSF